MPRAKRRPHFEVAQMLEVLRIASESPGPSDTIIKTALLSGLRRGELFALKWGDLETSRDGESGRLHVRRAICTRCGTPTCPC